MRKSHRMLSTSDVKATNDSPWNTWAMVWDASATLAAAHPLSCGSNEVNYLHWGFGLSAPRYPRRFRTCVSGDAVGVEGLVTPGWGWGEVRRDAAGNQCVGSDAGGLSAEWMISLVFWIQANSFGQAEAGVVVLPGFCGVLACLFLSLFVCLQVCSAFDWTLVVTPADCVLFFSLLFWKNIFLIFCLSLFISPFSLCFFRCSHRCSLIISPICFLFVLLLITICSLFCSLIKIFFFFFLSLHAPFFLPSFNPFFSAPLFQEEGVVRDVGCLNYSTLRKISEATADLWWVGEALGKQRAVLGTITVRPVSQWWSTKQDAQ